MKEFKLRILTCIESNCIELTGMADFISMNDSIVIESHDKVIGKAGSNSGAVITTFNPFSAYFKAQ